MTLSELDQRLALFDKYLIEDVGKARAVYTATLNLSTTEASKNGSFQKLNEITEYMSRTLSKFEPKTQKRESDETLANVYYDKTLYSASLPDYAILNQDKLSYVDLLLNVILPQFHPMPAHNVQYPVLTAAMFSNSNSLPSSILNARSYIFGRSGSGKTTLCKRWETHYKKYARCTWMSGSTGTNLAEKIHNATYVEGDFDTELFLRPSLTILNNIYADLWKRLQHQFAILLATELENAYYSRSGQDAGTFYTHSTIVLNGVDVPSVLFQENPELKRRTLLFYTSKNNPKLKFGAYCWDGVADEYIKLWHKDSIDDFYKILAQVAQIPNDISNNISLDEFECSRQVLATGVFLNVFKSIDEGLTLLENYWQYVNNELLSSNSDPLYVLLDSFLETEWEIFKQRGIKALPISSVTTWLKRRSDNLIVLDRLTVNKLTAYFTQRGFSVENSGSGLVFMPRN